MIVYRATLDVPGELVWFVAKLLLAERRRRGTPRGSRALTCFWQAVLGLRWFRDRTSPDALSRDHGISRATAYRYLEEVITVLADEAPDLREALEWAKEEGLPHVIVDGAVIPADRCREKTLSVRGESIDLWYSGKAHTHGGNIQAVSAPDGFPLWVSGVEPGSVHDLTAARIHALPALYQAAAAGLPNLAGPGYGGAGIGIHLPVKQPAGGRELDINTRTRNTATSNETAEITSILPRNGHINAILRICAFNKFRLRRLDVELAHGKLQRVPSTRSRNLYHD